MHTSVVHTEYLIYSGPWSLKHSSKLGVMWM